jgi:hypothetical protein
VISRGQKPKNVRTALENTAKIRDFQAEYTPAASSNGRHQRMSVSVVASPRNQPKIVSRNPYSIWDANPGITPATSGTNGNTCGHMKLKR